MTGWTLVDTHPAHGRTFQRPVDISEMSYVWDSIFNGTADTVLAYQIRLLGGPKDAHLFSDANIIKSWISAKRRFPQVCATIQGPSGTPFRMTGSKAANDDVNGGRIAGFASNPCFVVREHDLSIVRPGEIIFEQAVSEEEVAKRISSFFDVGPRSLSEDLLMQIHAVRGIKTDMMHLIIRVAHCVTDGSANYTFIRCFLDTLARTGEKPAQIPLEQRLAMTIPSPDVEPPYLRSLSPAKRRWRNAVASLVFRSRMEKIQGGHTLPARLTNSTVSIPAKSREISIKLSSEETSDVLANCRLHKITFGNAFLALAQVAMTRVLYRRYLRGEISEEEWTYRKKQPHTITGPLNLRPSLDKAWFQAGGGGEFIMSLGLFFYQLPFMSLGDTEKRYKPHGQNIGLSDGAPPFSELLTFDRFLYRTGLIKKQATALFKLPLFLDIVNMSSIQRLVRFRPMTLQWLKRTEAAQNGVHEEVDDKVLAVPDIPKMPAHVGSSFGDLASMVPHEYPIPTANPLSPYSPVPHPFKAGYITPPSTPPGTDSAPKIALADSWLHLHARPAELYITAWSFMGRMKMVASFDNNVFEHAVAQEWLDEIKGAVVWYLGQTHESPRGRAGPSKGVQAKL